MPLKKPTKQNSNKKPPKLKKKKPYAYMEAHQWYCFTFNALQSSESVFGSLDSQT